MSAGYFHYSVAARSRSGGYNAVLHAAYISGQELFDEREQEQQRWGSAERVVHHEISAPKDSPLWVRRCAEQRDQAALWNRAEAHETRKNSVLYRSINLGIDDSCFVRDEKTGEIDFEASQEFQTRMIRAHVERNFASKGMIASWAIHWDPTDPQQNPHAHIMLTTRLATEKGFGEKEGGEGRPWKENHVEAWRADWSTIQNEELAQKQVGYRIDHRSYERQGAPEVKPEDKHFGQRDRQAKNARHHEEQSARLARNPRPVFDLMSQSFMNTFSANDLELYVERFARKQEDQERLRKSLLASRELIALNGSTYTTQGIRARQVHEGIAATLDAYDRMQSWGELDNSLSANGFRLEVVKRDGKLANDLVRLGDPDFRVSAYRVDQRLGPAATMEKFQESRIRHELKQLAQDKKGAYRTLQTQVWSRLRKENRQDRDAFFAAWKTAQREQGSERKSNHWSNISGYVAEKIARWTWERRRRKLEERTQKRYEEAKQLTDQLRDRQERELRRELDARLLALGQPPTPSPEVEAAKKASTTTPKREVEGKVQAANEVESTTLSQKIIALQTEKFTATPERKALIAGELSQLATQQKAKEATTAETQQTRIARYSELPIDDLYRVRTLANERHLESLLTHGTPNAPARTLRDDLDQAILRHKNWLPWKTANPEFAQQVAFNITLQNQQSRTPSNDNEAER